MRIRPTILALGIAFTALSAQAQTAPQPTRPVQEGPSSVFVYERLGATPSLQRPQALRVTRTAQSRSGGEGEAAATVQVSKSPTPAAARSVN